VKTLTDKGRTAAEGSHELQLVRTTKKLIVQCDGSCKPENPGGWACWGFSVQTPQGKELEFDSGCVGFGAEMTSNVAEYHALIEALKWVRRHAAHDEVEVQTDSQLVVAQVNGVRACHAPNLQPLRDAAQRLLQLTKVTLVWVPRHKTTLADAHAKVAFQRTLAEKKAA
jgi:ribonuclease HI